jgi:phosphotriesterase-related protein
LSFVRTVLGDVPAIDLGVTAAHEHLIIDSPVVAATFPEIHLPSVEEAVNELEPWRRAGLGAAVDAMPVAQGGDASRLAAISRRSAVHVVASTGRHTARYDVDRVPDDVSGLTDQFVADLTDSEHPCGVIKVAVGPEGFDLRTRRVFAAAAAASAETGAPILTHCEEGRGGLEQVHLLIDLGVDPGRIALSHTDKVDDPGYHDEVLATGASLVYDQGLRQPERTVRLVTAMVDAGHSAGIMLGTDGARRALWSTLGGRPGLAWMLSGLVPELRRAGVTDTDLATILVSNPARWLEWDEPGGSAT